MIIPQHIVNYIHLVEKDFPNFETNEIELLLDHADIKMKAMIVLGFDCGLRVSEVAKLKYPDIDLKTC